MCKILILILFVFFLFQKNNAQSTLNQTEYDCMLGLMNKVTTYIPSKNSSGYYQFCSYNSNIYGICSNNAINSLYITQNTKTDVSYTDFTCFSSISFLTYSIIPGTSVSSIISYTYNKSFQYLNLKINDTNGMTFSKMGSNFKSVTINLATQIPELDINFSYINTTSSFSLIGGYFFGSQLVPINNTNFKVNYINDLQYSTKLWRPSTLSLYSQSFPNFSNMTGSSGVILILGFDKNSLNQNILTIGNLSSISITSLSEMADFPIGLSNLNAITLHTITFNMKFNTPSQMIDLTNIGSTNTFYVSGVGKQFHFNNKLPFIFPSTMLTISIRDAFIETLNLNEYYSNFSNLQNLYLSNNSMSGTLGLYNKSSSLLNLDFSYNQLTGTLDESFCRTYINVENNSLTGTIPSCFTCFFDYPLGGVAELFRYNLFDTDVDNPPPCTTTSPNLNKVGVIYEPDSGYYYANYIIFGKDLGGFFAYPAFVFPDYQITTDSSYVQVPNELFTIKLNLGLDSNIEIPKIFNFSILSSGYQRYFSLASEPTTPEINIVTWSGNNLIIEGSYFTYNSSIISINIAGIKCIVSGSTFYAINCTLSKSIPTTSLNNIATISIGNNIYNINNTQYLTSQITLSPNQINYIINCSQFNDCNYNKSGGYCFTETGTCRCNPHFKGADCSDCESNYQGEFCSQCISGYQGVDCDIPYISCPNDCSDLGICNNQTGVCSCNDIYSISPTCSPIECLDPTCGNNGVCNKSIGVCDCQVNPLSWSGQNCTVPKHFVSSIEESTVLGGNATFYGWFGDIHNNISILIGNKPCFPILSLTNISITCNASAGSGKQIYTIVQNSISYSSIYKYKLLSYYCINNCTSSINGKCDTSNGYCVCNSKYGGADCSLLSDNDDSAGSESSNESLLPTTETTINQTTGSTNFTNQKTNYQISIFQLVEVDINGNQVSLIPLQENWDNNSTLNSTIKLTQSIQNGQCIINYIIEEIKVDKEFSFADIDFKVNAGSIKISFEILNYQYQNSLNTIQLLMKSSVNTIKSNDKDNSCNDEETQIETIGEDNDINYITIKKDSKILSGRFINRLKSDGRSTYMSTSVVHKSNNDDTIIVAMNLPHFVHSLQIDPDFSTLISTEFKSSCPNENKKSWLIPVAVAIPVISCFIIIGVVVLIIKRRKEKKFINLINVKLSKIN